MRLIIVLLAMSLSAEIALSQVFPAPAKRPSESALVLKNVKELTD